MKSHFLENNVNPAIVHASGYKIWLAHYTNKTYYTGDYDVWQHCGSSGEVSIPGIDGYVDCDIWYIQKGITVYNGVDYSAVYDFQYYLNNNPDIKAYYGDHNDAAVLSHFVNYGMTEGRIAKESFNVQIYRLNYADLRDAYGDNMRLYYRHYMIQGQYEGRNATTLNSESVVGETTYNGTDYSAVYDYQYYLKNNPDIEAYFGDGNDRAVLQHFVNYGMSEGRIAKSTFNVQFYKNAYADLRDAFGDNLQRYYWHYIVQGQYEGRKAVQS